MSYRESPERNYLNKISTRYKLERAYLSYLILYIYAELSIDTHLPKSNSFKPIFNTKILNIF